jgi:hypothetical protein
MALMHKKGVQASRMHARIDRYTGIPCVEQRRLTGTEYFAAHAMCLPCGWWVAPKTVAEIANLIRRFYCVDAVPFTEAANAKA